MSSSDAVQEKNILQLLYLESGKIRVYFDPSSQQGTVQPFYDAEIDTKKVGETVRKIREDLDSLNSFENPDPDRFEKLKKSCSVLYDDLLCEEIKTALQSTPQKNLEIILEDRLTYIPLEWLFDGQQFLCEQFNIGRQIRTKAHTISSTHSSNTHHSRHQGDPLRMLIITDPREDLAMAQKEGEEIQKTLGSDGNAAKLTICSRSGDQVDKDFLKKELKDYDLVHYAGHVKYDPAHPEKSYWDLSDGKFSVQDIKSMAGNKKAMPTLIFCNACRSALIGQRTHFLDGGLVETFLKAGVQNYIGTFCYTSDKYGMYMGVEFYSQLIMGNTVAAALRKARVSFIQKYGQESISWMNYVFYGDPASYLIKPDPPVIKQNDPPGSPIIGADIETDIEPRNETGSNPGINPAIETGNETDIKPGNEPPGNKPDIEPVPLIVKIRDEFMSIPKRAPFGKALLVSLTVLICLCGFYFATNFFLQRHSLQEDQRKNEKIIAIDQREKGKRIEELKRLISEKLKARYQAQAQAQTKAQGQSQTERGTSGNQASSPEQSVSKPYVIAVFVTFNERERSVPRWVALKLETLNRKIIKQFLKDAKISVAEREELDKLLNERDLVLSDLPWDKPADRNLFCRFLYARAMLFLDACKGDTDGKDEKDGKSDKDSERIFLCYKLVDVERAILTGIDDDLELTEKTSVTDIAERVYQRVQKVICDMYIYSKQN